jgi:hypothetical protein
MPAFFGLTPQSKESEILEPFFLLTYYAGMSWETYYTFPIAYRKWLIDRINKEINAARKSQSDIPTKAPHHNTEDLRAMTGKFRTPTGSAKSQRFT